jgi:hypothetical protein
MRIIAKKYDGITDENTSELSWLGCSQTLAGRYMRSGLQSGNPDTSRDGDTERHIWTIELQAQTTQFIIRHTHPN